MAESVSNLMRSTLVVTNDFGPRAGGIESFVNAIVERLPRGSVVVHTSEQEGAREYDERLLRDFDIAVVRDPMKMSRWPEAEKHHEL